MKKTKGFTIFIIVIVAVLSFLFPNWQPILETFLEDGSKSQQGSIQDLDVKVHFIDVGQADCILITSEVGNMIVDAGDNKTEQRVVEYLKEQGVTTLDYVVATHPHSDHIGGLDVVIDTFDIKNVIMPNATNNTRAFEKLLGAIINKEIKASEPIVGSQFNMGEIEFTILAPNRETYDNLNNYSVGLKMSYGTHSLILTGDAEALSEGEMIETDLNLKANFLKIGHHGSYTSSAAAFLDAVSPEVAIICVGLNNDYGHPHKEVMERIKERDITVYRTDEMGDIVIQLSKESYNITYGGGLNEGESIQ